MTDTPELLLRREGDSNPRYAFDVYTLSRRASSTTRASLHRLNYVADFSECKDRNVISFFKLFAEKVLKLSRMRISRLSVLLWRYLDFIVDYECKKCGYYLFEEITLFTFVIE